MFKPLAVLVAAHIVISQGFSIQPKIVNGDVINATVPFFVSIGNMVNLCSASLISDLCVLILLAIDWAGAFVGKLIVIDVYYRSRWILTAAHCLKHHIPIEAHFGILPDGTF